jgi:hypothetical protein
MQTALLLEDFTCNSSNTVDLMGWDLIAQKEGSKAPSAEMIAPNIEYLIQSKSSVNRIVSGPQIELTNIIRLLNSAIPSFIVYLRPSGLNIAEVFVVLVNEQVRDLAKKAEIEARKKGTPNHQKRVTIPLDIGVHIERITEHFRFEDIFRELIDRDRTELLSKKVKAKPELAGLTLVGTASASYESDHSRVCFPLVDVYQGSRKFGDGTLVFSTKFFTYWLRDELTGQSPSTDQALGEWDVAPKAKLSEVINAIRAIRIMQGDNARCETFYNGKKKVYERKYGDKFAVLDNKALQVLSFAEICLAACRARDMDLDPITCFPIIGGELFHTEAFNSLAARGGVVKIPKYIPGSGVHSFTLAEVYELGGIYISLSYRFECYHEKPIMRDEVISVGPGVFHGAKAFTSIDAVEAHHNQRHGGLGLQYNSLINLPDPVADN